MLDAFFFLCRRVSRALGLRREAALSALSANPDTTTQSLSHIDSNAHIQQTTHGPNTVKTI